jgi:hypothetical protein
LSSVTGIAGANAYEVLKVYPNPSHGEFNLELEGTKRILIMDMTGIIHVDEISSVKNFSMNSLPKGIYLLQVNQDEKTYRSKLLID